MDPYHKKLLFRYLIVGIMGMTLVLLLMTIADMQTEPDVIPEVVQLEAPTTVIPMTKWH